MAASRQVREIFHRHTDLVEPLSQEEAYLDVTSNKGSLPTATAVAQLIRAQIREELRLTASAGVAPNKFLAKLASDARKPDGLFVVRPDHVDAFLVGQPLNAMDKAIRQLAARVWALSELALGLRARVGRPPQSRYRLVGVGLSNVHDPDDTQPQLF